ncbi:MAG TPA: PQQ-dependent sugar dehydrogenase [Polyangiaceae bacterium]
MRALSLSLLAFAGFSALVTPARADSLSTEAAAVFELNERFVTGLSQTTSFAPLPDGRMVITQKTGEVLVRRTDGTLENAGRFSVDSGSEKGLLNVLPHPSFSSNGLLYFYYSLPNGDGGNRDRDRHRVSTVQLGTNNRLDMGTLRELVKDLYGPANHDGGALAIGPDGKLYIGVGDTGCNSQQLVEPVYDPTNYYATCLSNGNGKILRVNLDGTIPSDNPRVGATVTACGPSCGAVPTGTAPAREDIWAWGFRNPWRFWFDSRTGNLWLGDVGERSYEEINVIPQANKGKHYGWPWREGRKGHPRTTCNQSTPGSGDCVEPAYVCRQGVFADEQVQDLCRSIIGGFIMDSCQWPAPFRGRYFFADSALVPSPLWSLDVAGDRSGVVAQSRRNFLTATQGIVHLAPGNDGALYYAVHGNHIGRVAPKTPATCPDGGAAGAGGSAGAGAGGAAGGAAGNGGASGTAGAGASAGRAGSRSTPGDDSDDGCGCRIPRSPAQRTALILALIGGSVLVARRRRKARQPRGH